MPSPILLRALSPAPFNPLSWYRNSEPGPWFDPSDLSTLYQDAAGTTPVTALTQPVGLILDKSQGLALGNELWADGSAVFSGESTRVSPGVYRIYTSAGAYSDAHVVALTIGKSYVATFSVDSITTLGGGVLVEGSAAVITTTGIKKVVLVATSTNCIIKRGAPATTDIQISNVSFKELKGSHASQSTAGSRPTWQQDASGLYYLATDGLDDGWLTPAINFTGTDKMTVIAGLYKSSDAAAGIPLELSATSNTNAGSFNLTAPASAAANYGVRSMGSISVTGSTASNYAAPHLSVLTGQFDIANDIAKLRVNGVDAASSSSDQGTGNFGNYPLYIGRRNNASSPFGGRIYGLIVRGAQTSDADISRAEHWMARKCGASL